MKTLAEELKEYFEARNRNPQWTMPATAKRLVRRAETLAAVRDELRQEVAELKERVKTLETLNGMLHANPPFSIMPTEYRGKLEAVVEAARVVLPVPGCTCPDCVAARKLQQALAALEEA